MSSGRRELLDVDPLELKFPLELNRRISCILQLRNKTKHHVAFKVLGNNLKKYGVDPNAGIVLPNSTSYPIVFTMQKQKKAPPDMHCKDKFLIRSRVVSPGLNAEEITSEMFNKEHGPSEECKIKVVYVSPSAEDSVTGEYGTNAMSSRRRELLEVDPLELTFPFELNKQISCSLQLRNKTNHHVAFKVLANTVKKYSINPNVGIVLPNSTRYNIFVTMRAQKEAPLDMHCKDKFLLRSRVVSPGLNAEQITSEMFNKEHGPSEKCKIKVVYVAPSAEDSVTGKYGTKETTSFVDYSPEEMLKSESKKNV